MIPYNGLPITPQEAAVEVALAGHVFVSWSAPIQWGMAVELAQSYAVDNGAFGAWKKGCPITDWTPYYAWVEKCLRTPNCDFAVIPDVIDGDEAVNDALLAEWPLPNWFGAPVWHMHESLERLDRLVANWPRVCLGSSGEFASIGTPRWWARMRTAMLVACDHLGRPRTKLHGLRMLDPRVLTRLPLSSADSTNIAHNIGIDKNWKGTYQPFTKPARARAMRIRGEHFQSPATWNHNS